jgi:hypothetical protein
MKSVNGPQCTVTVEIACRREVDRYTEFVVCRIIGHKWGQTDIFVCSRCGRSAFDA